MSTAENIEMSKSYITDALFSLMEEAPYDNISISDICKKAGVGRATFYRHFKTKEEVVKEYFVAKTATFLKAVPGEPNRRDDYYEIVFTAFSQLKQEKKAFQRLIEAHLESFYLDYMNRMLVLNFSQQAYTDFHYTAYHLAGSLCNVSLEWVRRDCAESVKYMTDSYFELLFPGV